MQNRFFSFVVPAHNEELIIEDTLHRLEEIDYPKERYEVIVVENGSTDATYEKAKRHESDNLKVYAAPQKGVSRARNFGLTKCSPNLDWCIFMDADVFIHHGFLTELNAYLEAHPDVGYGTTTVNLNNTTFAGKFWSRFNNFFYRLFKVLFTIHIVRKDLLSKVSYDENLVSGEDIKYGRMLSKYAKFFFMKTDKVRSSDRRFRKKGYLNMFFINLYHGITIFVLPEHVLKEIDWEVIR
ncbi:MAG TPA: glycosyltransferase family 2 protein [Candidatus Paceibacterota bacterium]|nr:glycosyltransferase family 2 protein [Candidatus Paceibacterota bacterium]